MLFIENRETDPALNMAFEEHLFFNKTEEIFMLWQNSPAIIIGKNQNAMSEIDYAYVKEHAIPVIRRLSGGRQNRRDQNILTVFRVNISPAVGSGGVGAGVGMGRAEQNILCRDAARLRQKPADPVGKFRIDQAHRNADHQRTKIPLHKAKCRRIQAILHRFGKQIRTVAVELTAHRRCNITASDTEMQFFHGVPPIYRRFRLRR